MKKILLLAATIFCFTNLINAQAGQLDLSFGNHGIVQTDLGKNYNYPTLGKIVLTQPDGSIYLILQSGEYDNLIQALITKRHRDGSIDSSYGINGFSNSVKMSPTSAILLQNGKIVIGGTVDKGWNSYDGFIARFNANGSLDSSFSDDGIQAGSADNFAEYNGKLVVFSGIISRYNSDGSPDSTFNGNGKVQTDGFANRGTLQSDGKIVVAGSNFNGGNDSSVYVVARYNTDGSPDKSFGNNGTTLTHLNSTGDFPNSVVIQKDGKILVGGGSLVRYNTDGSLDRSFSGDGIVATDFSVSYYELTGYSLNLQNNGKIVVSGNSGTIARYNTDGSIDSTFSGDGVLTSTFTLASAGIQNNKIIACGSENSDFILARYTANGAPDNTFDKDGKLADDAHSGNTIYKNLATQSDGKIVAAGRTWNGSNFDFAITRYNTDGSLDKTFSSDGTQATDFSSKNDYANAAAVQNDGKIVVVGYSVKSDTSFSSISIARYNTDGSLDNTFSSDGKVQTLFEATGAEANSVAIQSDGKIVAAGGADNGFAIVRYNANGSLDKTFDKDGMQTIIITDYSGSATSVAIQRDGKIVIGGLLNHYSSLARLNADGSQDHTFGYERSDDDDITYGDDVSMSLAIQNDGKIVIGGYNFYRGENYNFVYRRTADGKTDTSFHYQQTGLEYIFYYPNSDPGNSIAIQDDGKIIVASGAAFTRYYPNGSLDATFGNNGIKALIASENNIVINSIAVSGNKLYGAGFTKSPGNAGVVASYLLDNANTPPTVTLTAPANNASYLAPAAHIKLSAAATDTDGTITKVEFYNGIKLLHTETAAPYGYVWRNVLSGNYTLTAKAYDNSGFVATSAPIHISVVPNKAPIVSITSPADNQAYADTATIHLEAAASDADGRIANVKFYNGTTLLRTEFTYPYTYNWTNAAAGTYTITAVATDNWGAHTTSAPVTITVTSSKAMIVSNKPITNKTGIKEEISVKLSPNPATNIVNLYTKGLKQSKPADISIFSISGIVLKKVQSSNAAQMQVDVSSLAKGVYTIKIVSRDKVMYKQFIKL